MIRSSLALAFALGGVLRLFGADQATIVTGSDEFEFVYRVKLPLIDGEAHLWMPLARTDAFQTVRVDEFSIPMKWEKMHDRDNGNDICVLNPRAEDSGKIIELRYRVVRKEKTAYLANETNVERYLRPEKLVPLNQTFKTIAEQAIAGKANEMERAKALYDHGGDRFFAGSDRRGLRAKCGLAPGS